MCVCVCVCVCVCMCESGGGGGGCARRMKGDSIDLDCCWKSVNSC